MCAYDTRTGRLDGRSTGAQGLNDVEDMRLKMEWRHVVKQAAKLSGTQAKNPGQAGERIMDYKENGRRENTAGQ